LTRYTAVKFESKACMRLPVSELTSYRTVSELSPLSVQILKTFCVFEPPFGATYDVHLRLIGKRVVDFLLVLIELFR